MAIISGTNNSDAMSGKSGSDTLLGLAGNDILTGNDPGVGELLIDGSFETAKVGPNSWAAFTKVGGWQSDTGIEVWGKGLLGHTASHGDRLVELDYNLAFDHMWQDVTTQADHSYTFSFDYTARIGTPLATNTIQVYWNGQMVGSVDPASTAWSTATFEVVGTGAKDRIEFREERIDNNNRGGLIDNVSLHGANGADLLAGGTGNDVLVGQGGDDIIYGGAVPTGKPSDPAKVPTTEDNDDIHGGDGNDTAFGGRGNDEIHGDAGDDKLFGGRGNDTVSGGDGDDIINGNGGNDTLADGAGNDIVNGSAGDDRVLVGEGDDTYTGGSGFDALDFSGASHGITADMSKHIIDGMGKDKFHGFEGLVGSGHADVLKGSNEDNMIDGGAGDDSIRGWTGADTLTGGEGSDTFVWGRAEIDQQVTKGDIDHVTDFSIEDHLDLRSWTKGYDAAGIEQAVVVTDDGRDSHFYLNVGDRYVELAVLENVTGFTTHDMLDNGMLLAG